MSYNFNPANEILVKSGDKTFTFTATAGTAATASAPAVAAVPAQVKLGNTVLVAGSEEHNKALAALAEGFEAFAKKPDHKKEHLEAALAQLDQFKSAPELAAVTPQLDDLTILKQAIKDASAPNAANTIKAASTKTVEDAIVKNGNLFNLLPEDAHTALTDKAVFDLEAITKNTDKIKALEADLIKEIKAKTLTNESLTKILQKHGTACYDRLSSEIKTVLGAGPKFTPGAGTSGLNAAKVVTEVKNKIDIAAIELGGLLDKVATKAGNRIFNGATEEVAAVSKFMADNKEIAHHLNTVIEKHPQKNLFAKAEGMGAIVKSAADSAKTAGNTAKDGGFLTKTSEEIAKIVADTGKEASFWAKRTGAGKTLTVAAPILLAGAAYKLLSGGDKLTPEQLRQAQVNAAVNAAVGNQPGPIVMQALSAPQGQGMAMGGAN